VAQLPRRCLGGCSVMNRTKYDNDAKTAFAVKSEESLELLKAFLMIEDPKLRADIISIVKQTARVQPKS
jgi:hypothetical protein